MNKLPLDWHVRRKKISNIDLTENSTILDIESKDGKKAHYVLNKGQLVMTDINSKKNISPFVRLMRHICRLVTIRLI
jgi:hypothetical protein